MLLGTIQHSVMRGIVETERPIVNNGILHHTIFCRISRALKRMRWAGAAVILSMFPVGCAMWTAPITVMYGGAANETAILRVPFNVEIRSLDGEQVSKGIAQDDLRIQIGPGTHRAEVRYSVLYPTTGGDFDKIQSDYYLISFDCLAGGTYRIECDDPRTIDATRRYARHPSFRVLPHVTIPVPPAVSAEKPAPSIPVPATPSGRAQDGASATELKRVWEKATPAERRAFLDSMNAPRSATPPP